MKRINPPRPGQPQRRPVAADKHPTVNTKIVSFNPPSGVSTVEARLKRLDEFSRQRATDADAKKRAVAMRWLAPRRRQQ